MNDFRYLLVFRNEERDTVKYEEFSSMKQAAERRKIAQASWWPNEVVLVFGSSKDEILNVFKEYRIREKGAGNE